MTITATTWVPRGFASEHPTRHVVDDAELEKLSQMAKLQLEDAKSDLNEAKKSADTLKDSEDIDDDLKEYNLENYDEEEDAEGQLMGFFGNAKSLQYHPSTNDNENDAGFVTLQNNQEEDSEEREELQILPTDNLILSAKTEDDISSLEVYVYNDDLEEDAEQGGTFSKNDLYVHHDFMLPSEPLCVEWLDYRVGTNDEKPGNFAAIGTFDPTIEVWNLDTVDGVFPEVILGAQEEEHMKIKKAKKKKNSKLINDKCHVDAVLSLSANKLHRNLLASASADTTVKLWDLTTGTCAKSCTYHDDKVSAVSWNPKESTVLLSGGYDKRAIVADLRVDGADGQRKWKVDGDVECLKWGADGQSFYVASEYGRLYKFDARNESKSVWTLQAHDDDITCFDINENIDGYLATASTDKTVKLWNVDNNKPSMILSRDLDVGKVFSVQFAPDAEVAGHLSAAGTKGTVKVWDTLANRSIREAIGSKVKNLATRAKKNGDGVATVTVNDDEDDDSDGFVDVDDAEIEEDEEDSN